ncbi:uncharacterized protein [Spinacia oleracea]|uniref:Aminotransferase-like plant mobile domain-containing protein n=1 Tax=Spinacia oleracea TaxID=3562 RepID=A0ABM3RJ54_SPIOL|nr:uncharacterized protein LOC130470091 [Spinacia oleracea]
MSSTRTRGKFNLNEVADNEVRSSSNSEVDDSDDMDYIVENNGEEDDEQNSNVVTNTSMKRKRGRPKGSKNKQQMIGEKKLNKEKVVLETRVFKDNSFTRGGEVKEAGEVLIVLHDEYKGRAPTIHCKIEAFGKMMQRFDNRRRNWVNEMGFGGLYHLCGKHLPRNFVYWLMTRVDPINQIFSAPNGIDFPMSKNQIRWIFGLPIKGKVIPISENDADEEMKAKAQFILGAYGKTWESDHPTNTGAVISTDAIPVNPKFIQRLEGTWEDKDEEEFKTMFLIAAVEMVLCPTQCGRLSPSLLYACSLGMQAREYDWCKLVYEFFIERAKVFCRDFYTFGWTKGVGGCSMYLVIFYLDRLNRMPLQWGVFPRLKAWDINDLLKARQADILPSGDYGKIGCVDVAYGDRQHPRAARDSECPDEEVLMPAIEKEKVISKARRKGKSVRNPFKIRNPQPNPQPTPHPSPTPDPQPSPQPHPHPSPQPQTHPSPQPHSHPSPQTHSQSGPQPSPQPHPHPSPQPHPQPNPQPHPHPSPQPQPQPQPQPSPQPNPQPQPQPTPQPNPQPQPQPTPQPNPQPQTQPTPQLTRTRGQRRTPLSPHELNAPVVDGSPKLASYKNDEKRCEVKTLRRSPRKNMSANKTMSSKPVQEEVMEKFSPSQSNKLGLDGGNGGCSSGGSVVIALETPMGVEKTVVVSGKSTGVDKANKILYFQRTRPRRGRKKKTYLSLSDIARRWFTSDRKKFSYNLVEFVNHNGGSLSGRGNLKGMRRLFVSYSMCKMIKCEDGSNVIMNQCKGVTQLNGCVHKQYVDTVAKLYNSTCLEKYSGRSLRYMLSSGFAVTPITQNNFVLLTHFKRVLQAL